jgi:hypothetical protein
MTYRPERMSALLCPTPEDYHLTAVLNDPCADDLCLLVTITSIVPGRFHDPACVLDRGDHSFLRHPSFVLYRLAATVRAQHICNLVAKKYYLEKDEFPEQVFDRILGGVYISKEVTPRIIKYAKANAISSQP